MNSYYNKKNPYEYKTKEFIMKRRLFIYSMALVAFLTITSCNLFKSGDSNMPDMNFIYPLWVGNYWNYEKLTVYDFDDGATSNGLSDTSFYSAASVEIIDREIIFDEFYCYNFKSTLNEDGTLYVGNEYYNNTETQLIDYGYTNPYMLTPKVEKDIAYLTFKGKKFNNIQEIIHLVEKGYCNFGQTKNDSILFDQVQCLVYPLKKGNEWSYRTETYDGEPWRIDKKILGWTRIEVPAGNFNCWRIQWFNNPFGSGTDWDEDIIEFDYIAEQGLIKRILELDNLTCYDYSGNLLGTLTYSEILTLDEYSINNNLLL